MQKYTVIRHHEGDVPYAPGDIREADPRDVAHLIGTCLAPANQVAPEADQKKVAKASAEAVAAAQAEADAQAESAAAAKANA